MASDGQRTAAVVPPAPGQFVLGGEVRVGGKRYRIIKVGAVVDGQPDMVLLAHVRSGELLALSADELAAEGPKPQTPLGPPKPIHLGEDAQSQPPAPDRLKWLEAAMRWALVAALVVTVLVLVLFAIVGA